MKINSRIDYPMGFAGDVKPPTKLELVTSDEYITSQQKQGKTETPKKSFKTKVKEFFSKIKTPLLVIGSSILTALAVLGATSKKTKDLKNKNDELKSQNAQLKQKNEDFKKQLENIVLPDDIDEKVEEEIKMLNSSELPYVPTESIQPKKEIDKSTNGNEVIALPKVYEKTTLRADAKELNYPKFNKNKPYSFEFPMSSDVKITKNSKPFTPKEKTLTTISESYADSLSWDNDKIARDLLQNFYDGHGQTLDGVKFDVVPTQNGKYKVRISGKSTFSADKAILLGESSKKDDSKAAGNYGEGLKMVVLKLLKDNGADQVNIASDNWKVNWSFEDSGFDKKVLAYELKESEKTDGNYLEFETDNTEFIETMIKSFDRFYHYNNPAFKCPDFENDTISLKLTDDKKDGRFFIAGQTFQVDGKYEGLGGIDIHIKNKPPAKYNGNVIFDPSRDRISLNDDNLNALGQWIISEDNMSKEDAVKLIHSLEEYWDIGTNMFVTHKHGNDANAFISGIIRGAFFRRDLNIAFDEKNIASSSGCSEGLKAMYEKAGYRICSSYFDCMGMKGLKELVNESRKHIPLEPTPSEKNKLLILKQAIDLLSPALKDSKLFEQNELDTKIFIYDRKSEQENNAYADVLGEAITDKGKSLGFWVDKTYLNEKSFSELLATSLHELTHKFGGDESSTFSYKLTDVMEYVIKAINENPNLAIQLKILEKAWDKQK